MAQLEILHYPDKRLRTVAEPVGKVDDSIRKLVDDMLETMYAAPGIGLAATQVNVHKRVIVMDLSEDRNEPLCLINPEIIARDGVEESEEGCLSVPDIYEKVQRSEKVTVKALGRDGEALRSAGCRRGSAGRRQPAPDCPAIWLRGHRRRRRAVGLGS